MIDLETWAEIRRLHRSEGLGIKPIARRLGVARNTVRAALAADEPPRYRREPAGSAADAFEGVIAALLRDDPLMPATVIAKRVGWDRSSSVLRAKVAEMRPLFAGIDPADRTVYEPGDVVQCDLWFPNRPVPLAPGVETTPPVLTMVAAWCGFMMGLMIPTRTTGDLLAGMWRIISTQLGAVPRKLVWDHETGIGQRRLTEAAASFAGTLGCRIVQVKAKSPEHKGVVERSHDFLETSFEPGRSYTGPDDFNAQLAAWLGEANQRLLRRTGRRPADLVDADRAAMGALPPVEPRAGFSWRGRLGRDYHVRVVGNDYSVDPSAIGRMVEARAGLGEVEVVCAGRVVASHRRVWTARGVVTDPAHKARAAELRAEFAEIRRQREPRAGAGAGRLVAVRPLASYDELFAVPDLDPAPGPTLGVVR
jgi:transposase